MIYSTDKFAVDRLRVLAKGYGMRLSKSRERSQHFNNRGGLQLVDANRNMILAGVDYDLDVEEAGYWIGRYAQEWAA